MWFGKAIARSEFRARVEVPTCRPTQPTYVLTGCRGVGHASPAGPVPRVPLRVMRFELAVPVARPGTCEPLPSARALPTPG
jgi:hypothetical protein